MMMMIADDDDNSKHEAQSFFKYLNDQGQEALKTVVVALEGFTKSEEIDVPAFRGDDFLIKVLDRFQWLMQVDAPPEGNRKAAKKLFGKAAWEHCLKVASKKAEQEALYPSDLDKLESFSFLASEEQRAGLGAMSQKIVDSLKGTQKVKKARKSKDTSASSASAKKAKATEEADGEEDDIMQLFG